MGQPTLTNNLPLVSKKLRSLNLRTDVPLLVVTCALLVIGLLFVYSSSWKYAVDVGETNTFLVTKQFFFMVGGILIAFIISRVNYHRFQRLLLPMVILTVLALLAVLILKDIRNSAVRSIAGGSIQPSEMAKLAVIIYLAFWLNSKREVLSNIVLGLIPLMFILGVFMGLIVLQPDFSAALTVFALGAFLFYVAGSEIRQIVLVLVMALLVGTLVVALSSTGQQRIGDFIGGLQDPKKSSDHVISSITAITNGGVFGVGIGRGTTKFTGLPVPWTDSIFAVIVEESGLAGAIVVVGLYLLLLWRGMQIARRAPDNLGRILAAGVTFWIGFEAFINMGQMVNLVPFAGNALPLISAGGSSMVTTLAGVGVLLNVARVSQAEAGSFERRSNRAVVNLRRWDGRRGVSSPVDPQGAGE